MAVNLYTNAYSDLVDETVLKRFAVLDSILSSDQFLIGLSDRSDRQCSLVEVESKYSVVTDVVLGMDLYSSQKKPRKHKGEFSYFPDTITDIAYIATCIGYGTREYQERGKKETEANKRFGVTDELYSIVRSRAVEINLVESWSARPEFVKSKGAHSPEQSITQLEYMVGAYFSSLVSFAQVADFNDISLCALFVEQMEIGGLPCGWLSKNSYWDLSNLKSHSDYEKGYPKLHHGVFNDPTDKLAMLYLD